LKEGYVERTAFTTPDVARVFIACDRCHRVKPHYAVYGKKASRSNLCKCGNNQYRPVHLPEWQAALWVLVVGWFWRKVLRRESEWDPRMPIRTQP
jgi:hypothetical protein